jgi:hypothetical protein
VTVTATAADDVGVTSVQFMLNAAPFGEAVSAPPYQVTWDTTGATNAAHTWTAVARDAAGREATAMAVIVNVRNDVTAPTVAVSSPASGATVAGSITVTATAVDDVGVTSVQFMLDGAPFGEALSAAPYQVTWDTTGASNAAHTWTAVARDAAGRETSAEAVTVTVLNDLTAPTVGLASPSAGATAHGEITVAATAADDVGVTSVQFLLDGSPLGAADLTAPFEVTWPTLAVANGAHVLTAVARDAAGRETTSTAIEVTVLNDLAPPTVAVTTPAAGTVGGTVTIAATAGDDIGVTSVQFLLDGAPLGAADTEAPFQAEWITSATGNGVHTISAVARDAAGHVTTASLVTVTVVNDVTPPSIGPLSPPTAPPWPAQSSSARQ